MQNTASSFLKILFHSSWYSSLVDFTCTKNKRPRRIRFEKSLDAICKKVWLCISHILISAFCTIRNPTYAITDMNRRKGIHKTVLAQRVAESESRSLSRGLAGLFKRIQLWEMALLKVTFRIVTLSRELLRDYLGIMNFHFFLKLSSHVFTWEWKDHSGPATPNISVSKLA